MPSIADQGDYLQLKPSWTKGGKARQVPVRTEEQRKLINMAHKLAGKGSLIPGNRNYVQQLRVYEGHTNRAGLSKMHALRHAYAQRRYQELTGWPSPASGGPTSEPLAAEQRQADRTARLIISKELGHEREQVTAVYLGR
jgi:integrase